MARGGIGRPRVPVPERLDAGIKVPLTLEAHVRLANLAHRLLTTPTALARQLLLEGLEAAEKK